MLSDYTLSFLTSFHVMLCHICRWVPPTCTFSPKMTEKSDLLWYKIESEFATPPSLVTPLPPPLPPSAATPDLDLGEAAVGGRGGWKRGLNEDDKKVIICTAETATSLRRDMHTTPLFSRPYLTSYTSLSTPPLPASNYPDSSVESRSTIQYSSSVFPSKGILEAKLASQLDGKGVPTKVPVNDESHGIAVRMSLVSRDSSKCRESVTDQNSKGSDDRGTEGFIARREKEKVTEGNAEGEDQQDEDEGPAPHTPKLTTFDTERAKMKTWNAEAEGKGNEMRGEKFILGIIPSGRNLPASSSPNANGLPAPPSPRGNILPALPSTHLPPDYEAYSFNTRDSLSAPLHPDNTQLVSIEGDSMRIIELTGDSNRASVYTRKNSAASSSGNSLSGT